MPGFLGVHNVQANFINTFSDNSRPDLLNEKICSGSILLERRTINKFLNDKLFLETEQYVIVTEGVILNSKDLIKKYEKSSFRSTVIEMINKNPDDFFNEFRGSFSGLVYNKQNDCLTIYTDHTGTKQVFYSQTDNGFCFGSEINFLKEFYKNNNIQYSLDITGAYLLLTYGFMFEDITLFREFKKLKPGNYLKFQYGKAELTPYFRLNNTPDNNLSEKEIINKADSLFRNAVRRQFEKDKEYGYRHLACLSGGLDSRMTSWVANDLGYGKEITNMTFSQTNYWDEFTPKAITKELKHEWIFKSLDNGNCLKLLEPVVQITSGGALYSTNCHEKSMLDLINNQCFGIVHSGQIGEAVISTFWRTFNINKSALLKEWAYTNVLLPRLNADILKDTYENEEMFLLYIRAFCGTNQGLLSYQESFETYTPFCDVEFMNFCMTIPLKYRFGHYIYYKWVVTKYPDAAKYPHNGKKIRGNKPLWIKVGNRYIKSGDVINRSINYFLRKSGVIKSQSSTKNHMNPFEYWYNTNQDIKDFVDSYYQTNIHRLNEFPELQSDCANMFKNHTIIEKAQVLTLLAVMRLYF